MLRVIQTRSAAQAKRYYTHADYLAEDQERPGVWRGKLAERFGLSGLVQKGEFDALCDNRHPHSGERVTGCDRGNRTAGYDFNFHAPKSLSVLYARTADERLLRAFQESVDETMRLIEADASTRVRKGKRSEDRPTSELAWARFDHLTARPVGGVPDPHLHSHCFVMNMTFDQREGEYKAGQFRELKRDAPFYQAAFHAGLSARLRRLGLDIARTPDGWEVAGFDRATLDKFSRRTSQIEEVAAAAGITDPAFKAELGARTREAKSKLLSWADLRRVWADRLSPDERERIDALGATTGGQNIITAPPLGGPTTPDARAAVDYACRHLFERHSVVGERQLLAETLAAGVGTVSLADAERALKDSDVIVRNVGGRRLATTRGVLAEEERLLAFARDGRGRCAPLGGTDRAIRRDWLNAGQRAAVEHLWESPDRVLLVRGAAGVGKTTLMQEAVEGIERGGQRVFAFAPSAEAGRGVLRREGFADADTVARLLADTTIQERVRGQVLWVDEVGLLGSRQLAKVFDLAERQKCRVILTGDRRQHGAVERGAVLRLLEDQAGLPVAAVTDIRRQQGEYREAVRLLADGRTLDGFDRLDRLGWVREVSDEERYRHLATDYVEAVAVGKTALVVSPTHAEGARVTAAIRDALKGAKALGGEDRDVPVLRRVDLTEAERGEAGRYRAGDVLQFHQNAKGYRKGQRVVVAEGTSVPVDQSARFTVFRPAVLPLAAGEVVRVTHGGQTADGHKLENGSTYTLVGFTRQGDLKLTNGWVIGRDFGHLTHGYVSTSHASQGKTVDRVLVAQSADSIGATSREQFYVSASRARERVSVYTDDKAELREAIQRSDPRPTATELVGRHPHRERMRRLARTLPPPHRPTTLPAAEPREVPRD